MPLIQNSFNVPAGATLDNVLAGSQFEFLPYDASLNFGTSASGIGVVADVYSGQDVLAENMAIANTNRVPVMPDDYALSDVAGAGERIKIRVRNTSAAAVTFFFAVRIDAIG
jgi:hypothetical protein